MSDIIKHECGIALVRLLKPLQFYKDKYGSSRYGLHKTNQLMGKMVNRGQDGAGIATIKLDAPAGTTYINRLRTTEFNATQDIFSKINDLFLNAQKQNPTNYNDINWQKNNIPFLGELMLGHLRYGTFGSNTVQSCHPFKRQNNWQSRNLVVAGNFNLTNVDELLEQLIELGQHPTERADAFILMEKIGHFLDKNNDELFKKFKEQGVSSADMSTTIQNNLDIVKILKESSKRWDGGYVMAGMVGHGDAFVMRDPHGIRPAFIYQDDEIVVIASERPVIQTVFNVPIEQIKEVTPGNAIIIKKNGTVLDENITPQQQSLTKCSFERIYFSRGNDYDIYKERQDLGRHLAPSILKAINYDLNNTVFSYIPNTAEIAFGGLIEGLDQYVLNKKQEEIIKIKNNFTDQNIKDILSIQPRIHKVVIKDVRQRTFITADELRDSMVNLVYDITYGTVNKKVDTLVVIDDSIVRGTTLQQSILKILDRLEPKKIIICSSAPQIRYPDCYGIDMSVLEKFVAFNAAIELNKEKDRNSLNNIFEKAKLELQKSKEEQINVVKEIYNSFTDEQISDKIAQLIKPKDLKAELQIIYQTVENLHQSCPNNTGDWYFTGNYPTPGGVRVSNKAFVNYMEGKSGRAY